MIDISPVKFLNQREQNLFGILHLPDEGRRNDTGVIILSPGIKNRIAPHGLYLKLADKFTALGFPVLRFDFFGLGDSEGELEEEFLPDVYTAIQKGRYVDDTIAAMDWMEAGHGVKRFILTGLCGGAITGLLTGERDKRVAALAGIGIPVILDNAGEKKAQTLTSAEMDHFLLKYFRKLKNVKSIWRFITLQSDYTAIFRVLQNWIRKTTGRATKKSLADLKKDRSMMNFNFRFPAAFQKMLEDGQDIALFFGENDRLYWEYDEKFYKNFTGLVQKYGKKYKLYLTPGARHIFEQKSQLQDLMYNIETWVRSSS